MSVAHQLDTTFTALADPTRRAILARLARGEATVTELARPFAMSQPAVSKHIKVLEKAGLITRRREGTSRPCRIEPGALAEATHWLEAFRKLWDLRFRALDDLLEDMKAGHEPGPLDH
jgi:DNA-binding transcriptional ArsR family regulator